MTYRPQQGVNDKEIERDKLNKLIADHGPGDGYILYMVESEHKRAHKLGFSFSERLDIALDIVYLNKK